MAGSKVPSGSLRAHASTAERARSSGFLTSQKPAAPWKKNEFVSSSEGSSSDSDSDDSDSDSDIKNESTDDFKNRVSQTPSSKTKVTPAKATPAKATPAKSPTVNGLTASAKKVVASKSIKKEDTSSTSASSESESDSDSSSDEKATKASAKGKEVKQTKSVPKPESESSDESETSSESESESESDHAKKPKTKNDKKPVAQPKSPAKPAKKEESESNSEESESEADGGSDDAEHQIAQQIRNDLQSVKTAEAQGSASASQEPRKKKTKAPKSTTSEDDDGDVEMVDQPLALTNGGQPTKVGSVPEFVAPDFHLRKLDGSIDASDIAGFFEKAKMEGKQVWYITAPATLPVTVVQDLTIPMDQAQKGLPVLSHNGDDYRMAFDNPAASSSFRLLIPNKKGDEYSLLGRPVNQTMHFTRSETFPAEGPASITTTQTVATTKPARPQPAGLKARYTPLGVPAPKPTIAPPANSKKNKAVAKVAAQEAAATSTKNPSPKRKRKQGDDGENGPAATTPAKKASSSKKTNAEKPAKKQKTSNGHEESRAGQAGRKETPIPLPPQANGASSVKSSATKKTPAKTTSVPSASQPAPASRRSASPGAPLPSTQLPPKQTPIPIPIPKPAHVLDLTGPGSSTETKKARKKKDEKKDEKVKPKVEKGSFEEAVANVARTPKKVTPILPPRFGSK